MIPGFLARHVFYPAQEALCGRDSIPYWKQLEQSQFLDPDQTIDLQNAKLRRLIRHADEHCPFYHEQWRDAGIDPTQVNHIHDLRRLPILTKDEIRTHRERLLAQNHRGKIIQSCTSGSSGSPLIFYVDRRRERSDIAARLRAHRWFGLAPGDPAVYLWGSRIELDHHDRLKAIRDWLINERLLDAFQLSDSQLHRYADVIFRTQPLWLYSYAGTLWRFARFVREHRPELKGTIRRVAFATGEQLLPHWRSEIIAALECSVAEEYGCREGGLVAHECPEESYHLSAENIVLEILDEHDQPAPPDQPGRVVITNLEAYAMPFIRYDTGDIAAMKEGLCGCGLTLPMIHRPTGRTFEFLETHDGTLITGVSISRDLKEVEGLAHYRVVQETRSRVRVALVTDSRYVVSTGEAVIRQRIQARLGPATQVLMEYFDELPPHPSGKYRYVINAIQSS